MAALAGVSSNAGLMGLHLVSTIIVGTFIGWFLDKWLETSPWLLLTFLGLGIIAGFQNMWREARRINKQDDALRAARERGESELPVEPGASPKLTFFKREHFHKTYTSPPREVELQEGVQCEAPLVHHDAPPATAGRKLHEKSEERAAESLDEEALRQALIRELTSEKGDPQVAQALLALQQAGGPQVDASQEDAMRASGSKVDGEAAKPNDSSKNS